MQNKCNYDEMNNKKKRFTFPSNLICENVILIYFTYLLYTLYIHLDKNQVLHVILKGTATEFVSLLIVNQ